jgi:hypothetical protein
MGDTIQYTRKQIAPILIQVQNFKLKCCNFNSEKIDKSYIQDGTSSSFYSIAAKNDPEADFETINPVNWKKTKISEESGLKYIDRTDKNCIFLGNFIFECDNISLAEQEELIARNKNLINRCVFSGSKSYHNRVTLQSDCLPKNKDEYRFIHNLFNHLFFEGKADKSCGNPSRLTRRPSHVRTFKAIYKGIEQVLIFQNNNIFYYDWMSDYKRKKEDEEFLAELQSCISSRPRSYFKTDSEYREVINQEARAFLEGTVLDGTKHETLPSAVASFKAHGWSMREVLAIMEPYSHDIKRYTKKLYEGI